MQKIDVVEVHAAPATSDNKLHVRLTEGWFQNLRRFISWPLLALFFGLVWVQHDGQPWLLFSFAQHKIILFGAAYSWFDLTILGGLMITGAFLLLVMAVAWGRVWCGFACPQSIWTWLFIRIEDITEGRARTRAREAGQPWTGNRLARRIAKHLLWLGLAACTAVTFTGYFIPVRELVTSAIHWQMSPAVLAWLAIMASLTYTNAGLVREKICLHACPYARIQAVMFDEHTRTVSYDQPRGEPRAHKRNAGSDTGDCVDCGLCVQVCPVGIDIRDGLQAACIDCGACIDACNQVMAKTHRPTGLIRFTSEALLQGKSSPLLRKRLVGYSAALLAAGSAVVYGFATTSDLHIAISRDRNALVTRLGENHICNNYRIKVEGYNPALAAVDVSVTGNGELELFGPKQINLAQDEGEWLGYRVCNYAATPGVTPLLFHFQAQDAAVEKETTFLANTF